MGEGFRIRDGRADDLEAMVRIYNHFVRSSHCTFDVQPFETHQRRDWFESHARGGRHQLLVATRDGEIVGYAGSGPFRPKEGYQTTVETTVYCDPRYLGRGIGDGLYSTLFSRLEGESIHRVVAGIALPNPRSVALHLRHRFRPVGRFTEQGHKFGRFWDVEWYERPFPGWGPASGPLSIPSGIRPP